MFSRALYRFYIFPHLVAVASFPRVRLVLITYFPRMGPFVCFPRVYSRWRLFPLLSSKVPSIVWRQLQVFRLGSWFFLPLFSGVNLKGSDLEGSQLGNINLRVATLKGANLQNCNLRGAELAGADLEVRFLIWRLDSLFGRYIPYLEVRFLIWR